VVAPRPSLLAAHGQAVAWRHLAACLAVPPMDGPGPRPSRCLASLGGLLGRATHGRARPTAKPLLGVTWRLAWPCHPWMGPAHGQAMSAGTGFLLGRATHGRARPTAKPLLGVTWRLAWPCHPWMGPAHGQAMSAGTGRLLGRATRGRLFLTSVPTETRLDPPPQRLLIEKIERIFAYSRLLGAPIAPPTCST
jgi:hypothetical protein